ncbi:hypothetical protein AB0I39_30780 [Kitasatospora purpeofusca]|uniref:hypothetical protein n=1 Tax=Kitasatospora purpeofusca TaxID=67352 RepID=UPI0033C4CA0F
MAGWPLLASVLVTVPLLVHLGRRAVDEPGGNALYVLGTVLLLSVLAVVLGFSLAARGHRYVGVRKLRRIRPDGRGTLRATGHRLF